MGKTITKEEVAKLENEDFPGRISLVQTKEELEEAIEHLSQSKILGFDTETKPAFKKGVSHSVALLQLSNDEECFLFRVNKLGFPQELIDFLSNPKQLKIGLSLRDDFTMMGKRKKFTPEGFIDLQKIVKEHDIDELGLQKIYAILFNKRISKSQQLTNWEAETLTEPQKKYAALDAWACLKIYKKLCLIKESI